MLASINATALPAEELAKDQLRARSFEWTLSLAVLRQGFAKQPLLLIGIASDERATVREARSGPSDIRRERERRQLIKPRIRTIETVSEYARFDAVKRRQDGNDRMRDRLQLCQRGRGSSSAQLDHPKHPARPSQAPRRSPHRRGSSVALP